jgi:hypothetical protein
MKVVRIWLYRKVERLQNEDCKPSKTNVLVAKDVEGIFKYFAVDGESVRETNRREADEWAAKTGQTVETWRGYPSFMHDQGYRF